MGKNVQGSLASSGPVKDSNMKDHEVQHNDGGGAVYDEWMTVQRVRIRRIPRFRGG